MNKKSYLISFNKTNHEPIYLEHNSFLCEYLTINNSPILFGCRTGICGTCIVNVVGDISPPNEEEKEMLEIFAPGNNQARLACQLQLTNDIAISPLED